MFTNNKSVIFLLLICICFALTACSDGGSEPEDKIDISLSDNVEDLEVNMDVGDKIGESAAIPDTYPSDLFPIYEGSYIFSIVEYAGGFTITAFSKDDYTEVAEFYKDFLSETPITYETSTATGYTRFGTIDNFTYNFDTGISEEFKGYDSSIVIMLMPAQ